MATFWEYNSILMLKDRRNLITFLGHRIKCQVYLIAKLHMGKSVLRFHMMPSYQVRHDRKWLLGIFLFRSCNAIQTPCIPAPTIPTDEQLFVDIQVSYKINFKDLTV